MIKCYSHTHHRALSPFLFLFLSSDSFGCYVVQKTSFYCCRKNGGGGRNFTFLHYHPLLYPSLSSSFNVLCMFLEESSERESKHT